MSPLKPRRVFCFTTKEVAKSIAYVQIIGSVAILVSTGVFILEFNSSSRYTDQQLEYLAPPITLLLIIHSFQIVMGTILYDGVNEDNPKKLAAWMIAVIVNFTLIITLFTFHWKISFITDGEWKMKLLSLVPVDATSVTLTLFLLLVLIPTLNSCVFLWLVHLHRVQVVDQRDKSRRFLECLTNYLNSND